MESTVSVQSRLKELKSKLTANVTEDITHAITDQILIALLQTEPNVLQKTRESVIAQVEITMNEKIREDQVVKAKETIATRVRIAKLPKEIEEAAIELGQYAIVPNELYDPELTEERKQQAMESVEPVKILQGQIVVQEGHLIDREIYRQLEIWVC